MKILMVCLGNICRSPLADGLLRRKIVENKLQITVDSAGTSGFHAGNAPDERMIKTAKNRGTSIGDLRSRIFTKEDFDLFDVIYVMDESNFNDVLKLADRADQRLKVKLLLNELSPQKNDNVPDPYFGGDAGFEEVYDLLDKATDAIIQKLKNNTLVKNS